MAKIEIHFCNTKANFRFLKNMELGFLSWSLQKEIVKVNKRSKDT